MGVRGKGYGRVCPRDRRAHCSFVDAIDPHYKAEATDFLSWCWNYTLDDFTSAILAWLRVSGRSMSDTYLWVCFFCNNQYRILEERSEDGSSDLQQVFLNRLTRAGHMLVMLNNFTEPVYITRAWCIYESFVGIQNNVPMTIILPPSAEDRFRRLLDTGTGLETVRRKFHEMNIRDARATYEVDEDRIKRLIESSIGFDKVNDAVKAMLLDWLTNKFRDYLKGRTVEKLGG